MPKIEVSFDIDHNGILNVSAKDLATGKEVTKRIENSSGLSSAEVERMRKNIYLWDHRTARGSMAFSSCRSNLREPTGKLAPNLSNAASGKDEGSVHY